MSKRQLLLTLRDRRIQIASLVAGYLSGVFTHIGLNRFFVFLGSQENALGFGEILFTPFVSLWWFGTTLFLICTWFVLFLLATLRYTGLDRNGDLYTGAPHTARYMSEAEIAEDSDLEYGSMEKTKGIILGKYKKRIVTQRPEGSLNKNILVAGMAGSGKSTGFIIPYLYRAVELGESVVCVDTKGDIYSQTVAYAREHGYTIRVFNCRNPEWSDGWNVLGNISADSQSIERIANTIFDCIGGEEGRNETPFWRNSSLLLFKALITYVVCERDELEKLSQLGQGFKLGDDLGTIGRVFDILVSFKPGEFACQHLDDLFNELYERDHSHPALAYWNAFNSASKVDIKNSIIQNLAVIISAFQNKEIKRMLGEDEIDLTLPGKERCLYYVNLSEQNASGNAIASIFFRELTFTLTELADSQDDRRLPQPVTLLLDEFGAIGKIPHFDSFISGSRSRGIRCVLAFQNISQLVMNYHDGAETITANCEIWISTGIHDLSTAKLFSEAIGEVLIARDSTSVHKNSVAQTTSYSYSDSLIRQRLLDPSEIFKIERGKILVLISRRNVLVLDQNKCWEMPQAKGRRHYNIAEYLSDKEN